ncbi:MAG: phenylalanine--tRNA ligase subunit beta, partial [Bacteroidales bacterium]|nr:phenylalanine--tRNA ligase subunit beta [Bacteroidales bacterium]
MKISYNWLKQYINLDLEPEKVSELLTDCGLEVEGLEKVQSVKGGLEGVIIGKVVSAEKHPDGDKLTLTTVDIGRDQLLSIVCGAPNVKAGQKVPVATVGTKLFSNDEVVEIHKKKVRGEL